MRHAIYLKKWGAGQPGELHFVRQKNGFVKRCREEADAKGGEEHCGKCSFIIPADSDPKMASFNYCKQQQPRLALLSLIISRV